jgi:hypothetical protein
MNKNEGNIDRILRITAGVVLVGLASTGNVGMWAWIGIVPIVTGAIGWCPLYRILGFNTCRMKR